MAEVLDFTLGGIEKNATPPLKLAAGNNSAPVAATAAVVTLAADPIRPNVVKQIFYSYGATPSGGALQIEDGSGTIVWGPMPIGVAGLGTVNFDPPLAGTVNTALIVTLASGAGSVVGALYVNGWKQA